MVLTSFKRHHSLERMKAGGCPMSRAPSAMTDDCGQPACVGEMEPEVHASKVHKLGTTVLKQ